MAATTTATRHTTHVAVGAAGCPTTEAQQTSQENLFLSRWTPPRHDAKPRQNARRTASNTVAALATRKADSPGVPERPGIHRNHHRHFSKDGDERRHTDRTSATDCAAQTTAIPIAVSARRRATKEPDSQFILGTSSCTTAPGHE
ncbi:hypothetical protein TcBrA4_0075300 [Trypanosoma cruzi]|nr:hypothetical protein TcBrA4_0075300 [Trypanosoma cruzi]